MRECDLIMKGGVASGVAYPGAVARLAERYRLRNIGGTSAGAIAAVLAGAAEYRRQRCTEVANEKDGFLALSRLAPELGRDLKTLFQPTPSLQPLYRVLIAVATAKSGKSRAGSGAESRARSRVRSRIWAGFFAVLSAFWWRLIIAAVPGLVVLVDGLLRGEVTTILLGLILLVLIPAIVLILRVWRLVAHDLARNQFGLCTGLTTAAGRASGQLAFTDWMHERIESVSGPRDPQRAAKAPLTVGDLATCDVSVVSVTTDLSTRRPWRLPLQAGIHAFSVDEFRRIVPRDVLDWLIEKGAAINHRDAGLPDDLYRLPDGDDMPLVLLARLSLSFPGLVSAVPLYRQDRGLRRSDDSDPAPWRRCLFSDGGISSNFPIHFFDAFLPSRPTFGITFAPLDVARHGSSEGARVELPRDPPTTLETAVHTVDSLTGFFAAVISTATNWQDTLQSQLAGYAERIVEIRLDPASEGGLHVEMDEATIERLAGFGVRAAAQLVKTFDFDEHRYRRALTLLPTLDRSLGVMAKNYRLAGDDPDGPSYEQILTTYRPEPVGSDEVRTRYPLAAVAEALVAIGDAAARRQEGLPGPSRVRGDDPDDGPVMGTEIRLVANADVAKVPTLTT